MNIFGFWCDGEDIHILIMQKSFLGEIEIPDTYLKLECSVHTVSPTIAYVSFFQTSHTILFEILYEKYPPFWFCGSSHMGKIFLFMINNIQFFTSVSGSVSVIATVSSTVENVATLI